MSIEQGIIQAMIAISAILAYAAFNLAERHSVFSTFLFLSSLMFMPATLFTSVAIADVRNFPSEVVSVVSYSSLAIFMVAFFALMYFGIIIFTSDALRTSTGTNGGDEFSWETGGDQDFGQGRG